MERRSLLRTESLLIAVLVATGLAGCLDQGPAPADAEAASERAVDPLQFLPEGPLRTALAPEPAGFPEAPATASDAMRLWMDFPSLPLPAAAPVQPLDAALEAFAAAHHTTVPGHHLDSLDLDPAREAALARVVLAFLAAEELQAQATAQLTAEELAFLGGHPEAVDAWSERTGRSGHAAYEAEAQRLVQYIDVVKNLQAADLLARAVEELRGAMEGLPSLALPASHIPAERDADQDGVPDAVEEAAGSDPDDPADNGGDVWQPDHALESGYGEDVLLRMPSGGDVATGLLILGPGESVVDESPLLLIDLGGDDTYRGEGFGGVIPLYPNDAGAIGNQLLAAPSFPLVRLNVDVGGNDDYIPTSIQETHDTGTRGASQAHILYGSALGGAIVGVAMMADFFGDDTYRSTASLTAIAHQSNQQDAVASATVYGAMLGAGAFGGVGVLLDGAGSDEYNATVYALAQEVGEAPVTNPRADGIGIVQGGGYIGGIGILLDNLGGDDTLALNLDLHTPGHPGGFKGGTRPLAVSHGAAQTGAGILVDAEGNALLRANGPLAQGAARTAYFSDTTQINPAAGTAPGATHRIRYLTTYPSVGILYGSSGDGTYAAGALSQGAALGAHGEGNPDQTEAWTLFYNQPSRGIAPGNAAETYYAPATGMLIDLGGNDAYEAEQGARLVQGSAALGATALLLDITGDDVYSAPGGAQAQGSAWLAQGLLIDQFGHDQYLASTESQGFATDDPQALFDGRGCIGHLHSISWLWTSNMYCSDEKFFVAGGPLAPDNSRFGTSQAVVRMYAQVPTMGALVDRQGIDLYQAQSSSQGKAAGVLQYTVESGVCRTPYLYMDNINRADPPRPFPLPYLRECGEAFPDERDENRGDWTEPDTSAPPTHGLVMGLLLDTGNHDTYNYGGQTDKHPLAPDDDGDGNNWSWDQTEVESSSVGDTRLPQDNDAGTDNGFTVYDPQVDEEPSGAELDPAVGETLDHPSIPEEADADIPDESKPVYGFGVDNENLDGALHILIKELASDFLDVSLTIYTDEALENELPAGQIAGSILYAHVQVTVPEGVGVDRIDLFANSMLIHETTGSAIIPWDTTEIVDNSLTYPDGNYFVQASAVLELGRYGPISIESESYVINLNNAPQLEISLSTDQMSPVVGESAKLTFRITEDLEFPDDGTLTEAEKQRIAGKSPGAFIQVVLDGVQDFTLLDTYYPQGEFTFNITGVCDGSLCPEDDYAVTVYATDSIGNSAPPGMEPLLMDSTPPISTIQLDTFSGANRSEAGKLIVDYRWDINPGGASGFAPIDTVHVYRLPGWPDDTSSNEAILVASGTTKSVNADTLLPQGKPATFMTVAVDNLGNSESPCTQQELDDGLPCVADKLNRFRAGTLPDGTGPVTTVIDFVNPIIEEVRVMPAHGFVKPGVTLVAYEVYISESETDIASATISFDGAERYNLTRPDPLEDRYVFENWVDFNHNRSAQEELFVYSINVLDQAGNDDFEAATGTLDALAPRLSEPELRYVLGGETRTAGGPQSTVHVRLDAQDATTASVASVRADFSAVDAAESVLGLQDCTLDTDTPSILTDWVCTIVLPGDVLDGTYPVYVTATDLVGNAETVVGEVVVSNNAVAISEVRVTQIGPDFIEVSWTTAPEGSSRVYYGRDAAELRQSTERDGDFDTQHSVRVEGLAPSTLYFLRAASENLAGSESLSDVLSVRTAGAVGVDFVGLERGQILSGTVEVPVEVFLRTEGDEAQLSLFSERTDGRGGRQLLAQTTSGAGDASFQLDTKVLGDGPVRLVVKGARGADVGESTSPDLIVDNTGPAVVPVRPLPGMAVHAAEPVFDLLVFNAGDGAGLDTAGLVVRVDGKSVTPLDVVFGGSGVSRTLRITLPALDVGEHQVAVELADLAGNVGTTALAFTAGEEDAGDDARVDYGGRSAARPGATVRFMYDPLLPLDAVEVALSPLAPGTLPLAQTGSWGGAWTVPAHATSGTYLLDLIVTDSRGQETLEDALALVVDGEAPAVQVTAVVAGPSSVDVEVGGDEPVTLQVLRDGQPLHRVDEAAAEHSFTLKGLEGGTELKLDVVVWDGSGNSVSFSRPLLLPKDSTAPGAVDDLRATVHGGDVLLTWSPATDDAGVTAYRVERDGWSHATAARSVRDRGAPGGTNVTYRVTAVDAAGNAGPASEHAVAVPGSIEVLETTITPEVGDTSTPFEVVVALRHNLPDAPDVTLTVRDRPLSLQAVDPDADCRQRCWYSATTTLPASRLGAEAMDLRVEAGAATAEASVPATSVTVLGGPDDQESPAALLLLPLLAALAVARRWRR